MLYILRCLNAAQPFAADDPGAWLKSAWVGLASPLWTQIAARGEIGTVAALDGLVSLPQDVDALAEAAALHRMLAVADRRLLEFDFAPRNGEAARRVGVLALRQLLQEPRMAVHMLAFVELSAQGVMTLHNEVVMLAPDGTAIRGRILADGRIESQQAAPSAFQEEVMGCMFVAFLPLFLSAGDTDASDTGGTGNA